MANKNIKALQKEVCDPALESSPLKKFCAPCVPNQSYIEPDWEFVEIGDPYLNEKQCEYQVTLTINKFGDSFTAREFRNFEGRQQSFTDRNTLLQSFIHPAIVLILEENGKLVADQIICATFDGLGTFGSPEDVLANFSSYEVAYTKLSEQPINSGRIRCGDFGPITIEIDSSEPFDFGQTIVNSATNPDVKNPFALELYTKINDFYIDPIENVLKVHVGVPAFIIDQVPELPSQQELEEESIATREEVSLNVNKLYGQIQRLQSSMAVFGKYQSYFYQTQDGFLKFKESGRDYYSSRFSSKINKFYSDLKALAKKNGANIRSALPSLKLVNADTIRIEFKTGPNGNPYVIKSIFVMKNGCEEIKLRKGIKKFKQTYNKKPTLLNYIAKIDDIDMTLQARETTPWLDFLVKYTYPTIIVDYGSLSMEHVRDTLGKCVEENAREFGGELRDYILNESLDFIQALSYQYSSAASCEELYETKNQPEKKEFENETFSAGLDARKSTKEQLNIDPSLVISEQIDVQLPPLNEKLQRLRSNLRFAEEEKTQILNLPASETPVRKLTKVQKKIQSLRIEINSTEADISILENKREALIKDATSEDGLSSSNQRQLRRNAGRKARRNRKKHPYAKKAAKVALEEVRTQDTLLSSLIDWEYWESSGTPTFQKLKEKLTSEAPDLDELRQMLSNLSICNMRALTVNGIRCLFSGVTKERAFDKMFRAAMQAMDLDVFGFFIGNLPPDKQAELREKLKAEFGNIPLPWEEDYDAGGSTGNPYKKYLSINVNDETTRKQRRAAKKDLKEAQKEYDENKPQVDLLLGELGGSGIIPEIQEEIRTNQERIQTNLDNAQARSDNLDKIEISGTDVESFKNLSDEEKQKMLAEQKSGQGTFGTALGNVQEAVVDAYIEYIFDILNIEEIGEYLGQVPGGTLVFNTLDQILKCSTQGLFNPPIKSFLSSLTLDVCGEDRHVGLTFPDLVPIQWPKKGFFLKTLRNAFVTKMETILTQVIVMLLLKAFETVDNALCKSLNATGQFLAGSLTGGTNTGLDDAFADAFCPDADDDELDAIKKNAFGNALGKGAVPDSAYDCLFKAVNGTMSKREIIDLLTNTPKNMDDQTAAKISLLVNSRCPELTDLLGDPEDVKDAFGSIGKYIPPELKDFLRNQPADDLEAPIYDAICLTQDELARWNADRMQIYLDNGLDEKTADEMIQKANDRALDNLGSLADMLQKGPEGLMEEAMDALLKPADPACASDPSAIILQSEEMTAQTTELIQGFFKSIENKFLEDLIGERGSLLGNILIDSQGNHLQQHKRRVNLGDRTFLFANYVDTDAQWDEREEDAGFIKGLVMNDELKRGQFPDTVGLQLLEEIKKQELNYVTNKDNVQLRMSFLGNGSEDFKSVLSYKLNQNKKSTQRVFVRKTVARKIFDRKIGEDETLAVSVKKNNQFNDKEIGLVNYDFFPNEIKLLSNLIKKGSGSSSKIKTSFLLKMFDKINTNVLRTIRDSIVTTASGEYPVGFSYGYDQGSEIKFEDLLYVNPSADPSNDSTWEYTFDEQDAVLGKSATENPRVHFLDPAVHGGRYKAPKIYIEPASYNGWLGTINTFLPESTTCEDVDDGFLNVAQIVDRVDFIDKNLPLDKRLNQPIECRLEVPYDRQILPTSHAMMEGVVIATVRTYATEFIIRTFPIFGSIQFSSRNADSLITKVVAERMQEDMTNSPVNVFSQIDRLAYYLLFLEQSVQVVQRQIIDGLMKETDEIKAASKIINRAQNNYEDLKRADQLALNFSADVRDQINKGLAILAFGEKWEEKQLGDLRKLKAVPLRTLELARKVAVIHETQEAAEVFLAALIESETELLSKKINLNLRPSPPVFDIQKFMLSKEGIVKGSDIKSGLTSIEQQVIEGGNQPSYGEVVDCPSTQLENPLTNGNGNLQEFNESGILYIDKYVRVITKDGEDNVMKISEFQSMISDRNVYDENECLSHYFGDAEIVDGKLTGTIGVKFGVRIVMGVPKLSGLEPTNNLSKERLPNSIMLDGVNTGAHFFPIASYELDVIDEMVGEIDLLDPNMGEELKCYIDQLAQTKDFQMLFDKIIKTRSFVSIFATYSFENFLEAIGKLEVDEERHPFIIEGWKERVFNDTRHLLRGQFRSIYGSDEDESGRDSRKFDANIDFLKNLLPPLYLNIGSVGFLTRLRIVDSKPFDENGDDCGNPIQKLFEDD